MSINLTTLLLSAQSRVPDKQVTDITQTKNSTTSIKVNIDVAFGIDAKPLTLAYQAAIDRINEAVAPYLGEDALARGYESGVDVSPEATAERIVSRSTAMFSRFQVQHAGDDTASSIHQFVDIIRGGVERGFTEARDILSSLGVLKGDIEANIDRTFELTLGGLADFQSRHQWES